MLLKMLLVDSEPKRPRSLEHTLAAAGFTEIMRAKAGVDLVETDQRLASDLVVIDMALPNRDASKGCGRCGQARRSRSSCSPTRKTRLRRERHLRWRLLLQSVGGVEPRHESVVVSAVTLFKRYSRVETELAAATAQLKERQIIERGNRWAPAMSDLSSRRDPSIAIGLLCLTDSALVIVAHEFGFFADEGLDAALSVEPSWANIADKLAYEALAAALSFRRSPLPCRLGCAARRSRLFSPTP